MRVDVLRKKLHSHIVKSEPFVEIWRRARQVCMCAYAWCADAVCACTCVRMCCVVGSRICACCHALLWIPLGVFYTLSLVFYTAQVQELSNKATARYDKANSQHLAAKEMIRVAESQLAACRAEQQARDAEPSSPSPLDLAWQEMLNHATSKVRDMVGGGG